jgi:hypothetical protein
MQKLSESGERDRVMLLQVTAETVRQYLEAIR